jgi:hypothetical protein
MINCILKDNVPSYNGRDKRRETINRKGSKLAFRYPFIKGQVRGREEKSEDNELFYSLWKVSPRVCEGLELLNRGRLKRYRFVVCRAIRSERMAAIR